MKELIDYQYFQFPLPMPARPCRVFSGSPIPHAALPHLAAGSMGRLRRAPGRLGERPGATSGCQHRWLRCSSTLTVLLGAPWLQHLCPDSVLALFQTLPVAPLSAFQCTCIIAGEGAREGSAPSGCERGASKPAAPKPSSPCPAAQGQGQRLQGHRLRGHRLRGGGRGSGGVGALAHCFSCARAPCPAPSRRHVLPESATRLLLLAAAS